MTSRRWFFVRALLFVVALEAAVAVCLALVGSRRAAGLDRARFDNRRLVSELGLADLALWSDASYCRHPSLAFPFSALADHPSAMEHFPAGSMVPPLWVEPPDRLGEP
jgi:hypothetical protein